MSSATHTSSVLGYSLTVGVWCSDASAQLLRRSEGYRNRVKGLTFPVKVNCNISNSSLIPLLSGAQADSTQTFLT